MTSEGFNEFVVSRSTRLLRCAYLLTGEWAAAEDLLQSSLVKAWSAWSRIEGDPEPYVRRILVNTQASWWRRRWRAELPSAELPEVGQPGHADRVDDRDQLWQALRRLPTRQRTVLVLRYFENLSEAEIAEAMDCSLGTVKSQASRALAKLRLDDSLTLEGALP
ncbi:RNA polymerase sigma-70 factor (sigma-E family) [Krasilnikovia cinnamomea]|uniref:RNA polymerase sigma-70 factor (Sigma-E family) n=1 Tax=Krasilnikovia cinnamomea TaxID=349313 RepID=A0A4Q7ZJQ4_9ACTN|nr:SigE family RNA polymerase sigma factor [Krasilnikovia cinnamomea]RZU51130.1 RNA polymerase sigma-70 factor (sigma-E family) [Krasilnikovia cinnamomea]